MFGFIIKTVLAMIFQKGHEAEHHTYSQFCKKRVTCVHYVFKIYTNACGATRIMKMFIKIAVNICLFVVLLGHFLSTAHVFSHLLFASLQVGRW